jgi:hypothetical protein
MTAPLASGMRYGSHFDTYGVKSYKSHDSFGVKSITPITTYDESITPNIGEYQVASNVMSTAEQIACTPPTTTTAAPVTTSTKLPDTADQVTTTVQTDSTS